MSQSSSRREASVWGWRHLGSLLAWPSRGAVKKFSFRTTCHQFLSDLRNSNIYLAPSVHHSCSPVPPSSRAHSHSSEAPRCFQMQWQACSNPCPSKLSCSDCSAAGPPAQPGHAEEVLNGLLWEEYHPCPWFFLEHLRAMCSPREVGNTFYLYQGLANISYQGPDSKYLGFVGLISWSWAQLTQVCSGSGSSHRQYMYVFPKIAYQNRCTGGFGQRIVVWDLWSRPWKQICLHPKFNIVSCE